VGTELAVLEVTAAPAGSDQGRGEAQEPHESRGVADAGEGGTRDTGGDLALGTGPRTAGPEATQAGTGAAQEGTDDGDALRRRSSPLVRRLAREHGVELSAVPGTGAGGRVRKEDMLAYLEARGAPAPAPVVEPVTPVAPATPAAPPAAAPPAAAPPAAPLPAPQEAPAAPRPPQVEVGADEEVLPLSPMRRAIAEHMVRSVTTAPHAWTYVEVDVAGMVKWREQVRAEFRAREGYDLTYVPFVAKALVETLREHPILNSTWRDGQVVLKRRIHLGVAVALEEGLVVPVIRDADSRSIAGLARALHDLVDRARRGKLLPDDVQGGTFTLNNTGSLGSVLSMPIINQPQAAILTMEAITRRVVVTAEDAIAVRPMLNLCLSFDHRVCDGLQVGHFLQRLKGRLEAVAPGGSIY
jgi:2-oxoisovalerate dehydrogenase E2 component (dihydrolipoyl transacylase)